MSTRISPAVAPCSHEAAKWAVMNWHYSQAMPAGKLIKHGVWEHDKFIGVVLYGRGANSDLLTPYGLDQTAGCELVRIAMREHEAPVSQVVSTSLRMLHESNPGLRVVVSFADPEQQHHGGIYQAGNWLYLGMSDAADEYIVRGERIHGRSLRAKRNASKLNDDSPNVFEWARKHLDPDIEQIVGSSKHRYVMPLDRGMRRALQRDALPYPRG